MSGLLSLTSGSAPAPGSYAWAALGAGGGGRPPGPCPGQACPLLGGLRWPGLGLVPIEGPEHCPRRGSSSAPWEACWEWRPLRQIRLPWGGDVTWSLKGDGWVLWGVSPVPSPWVQACGHLEKCSAPLPQEGVLGLVAALSHPVLGGRGFPAHHSPPEQGLPCSGLQLPGTETVMVPG